MKKHVYNVLKIMMLIFVALCLTACWSIREINTLGIVIGVGIDKTKQAEDVHMTVQIANPSKQKSNEKTNSANSLNNSNSYINLYNRGNTIFHAVKGFNRISSRKLFFPDNQVIIFGSDVAEEGLGKYIDFFLRNRETRHSVWILVCKGNASEVFDVRSEFESTPSRNIGELVSIQRDVSQAASVDLGKFSSRMMSETTSPIAPIIEGSKEGNINKVSITETAVFKKDKMIGVLNKAETRGLLWALDEVKDGDIVLESADTKDKVSLAITRSRGKIIPKIQGDDIYVRIEIKEEGDLAEQYSSENLTTPKAFEDLEKAKVLAIRKEIMSAVQKAKELDADIFGFGDALYQYYPDEWKDIKGRWDEVFKNITVEISVEAKLRKLGRITKPILTNEK